MNGDDNGRSGFRATLSQTRDPHRLPRRPGLVAVHPIHQRQGVGKALIAVGLSRLKAKGGAEVLVLGDPAYYSRSGFRLASRVTPPYPLPAEWTEAWQWQRLDGMEDDLSGRLVLPEAWVRPELWG